MGVTLSQLADDAPVYRAGDCEPSVLARADRSVEAETISTARFDPETLRRTSYRVLLLLGAWAACSWHSVTKEANAAPATVEVSVDNTVTHQTMYGFGAGHRAEAYADQGDVLTASQRTRAIAAVYQQVGITTGNLDSAILESPGTYDQRQNDNGDPFLIKWSGFQTFRADAVKAGIVDRAAPFGFTDYFLAEKINIRWASPWMDAIRKTDYSRYLDEAAEQVAAGQMYWRDHYGIVLLYQMLFNEPLSGNGELFSGTEREVVDLVKRVGARLRSEGFADLKFLVPNEETVGRTVRTAAVILADGDARQYVGAIGYHPYPYGSPYVDIGQILSTSGQGRPVATEITARNRLRDLAKQYGVPAWMTEISHGGVDPRSFDALRGRAIHIHDELAYADASAYFADSNMWDRVSQQLHFGTPELFSPSNEGAVVFIDQSADSVTISGLGYAIGHYARWVKKGAVRIDATTSDPLVQVSAFRDAAQKRLVLVIINNAASDRQAGVALSGVTLGNLLSGEQSTAAGAWRPIPPFAPHSTTGFALTVPAYSVTTVSGPDVPGSTPTPSTADRLDTNCDGRVTAADLPALTQLIMSADERVCAPAVADQGGLYTVADLEALIEEMFR